MWPLTLAKLERIRSMPRNHKNKLWGPVALLLTFPIRRWICNVTCFPNNTPEQNNDNMSYYTGQYIIRIIREAYVAEITTKLDTMHKLINPRLIWSRAYGNNGLPAAGISPPVFPLFCVALGLHGSYFRPRFKTPFSVSDVHRQENYVCALYFTKFR